MDWSESDITNDAIKGLGDEILEKHNKFMLDMKEKFPEEYQAYLNRENLTSNLHDN